MRNPRQRQQKQVKISGSDPGPPGASDARGPPTSAPGSAAAVRPGPARPEFLAKYKDRAAFLKSLTAAELDGPGFRGCETGALYELDYSSAAQEGLI